jgi:alanine racemase
MGRLGIPYENALMDIEQIAKMEGIIIDGIYTHFPAAEEDIDFSKEQINRFKVLITELKKIDIKIKYFHAANSAAVFNLDDSINPPFNMVRVGLALYGYSMKPNGKIKNSLSLKTKIIVINKLKKGSTVSYQRLYKIEKENEYIAVLPVGYADGIPTIYSNKGKVVIKDVVYPIAGKICMDYMMVSLGDNSNNVQAGDEVTLFGNDKISVENFAKACQKIPYEVTCDISKRVPRVYLRKEDKR